MLPELPLVVWCVSSEAFAIGISGLSSGVCGCGGLCGRFVSFVRERRDGVQADPHVAARPP